MATLDSEYIVGIGLGEYFVDKDTGLALSGGQLFFYEDSARGVPKTVYQLTGSPPNYTYTALPNPITLNSTGQIVNADGTNVAVYYRPYDANGDIQNYYVVVKSSTGVTQFERQAWPNVTETSSPTGDTSTYTQNELSNTQFIDVGFDSSQNLSIAWVGALSETTYKIAKDWDIVIEATDTGSVTLTRNALVGSLNIETNPPYELEIVASSVNISNLKLVQRLSNNPDVWANKYVEGTVLVNAKDSVNRTVSMNYAPSVSVSATTILAGTTGTGGYTLLKDSVLIPASTNSDNGNTGYVDIEIILPTAGNFSVTSVQATASDSEPTPASIAYQEVPSNRQKDQLFHNYLPQIELLAMPNLLEGWDFRVNPAQWGSAQSMAAVRSQYLWDQTIGYQELDNSISVGRAAPRALDVSIASTTKWALIQYIEGSKLRQLLQSNFSTLLTALTDISGGVSGTISFWVTTDASLPDVSDGVNNSIVLTLDDNGKPATFNGNWTELTRTTGWDATFTIPQGTEYTSLPFEGWAGASTLALDATYTYGAIVVGFESTGAGTVTFQSISVTPTLIASPFAPMSYELTLKELERYYEKSYEADVNPGTPNATSYIRFIQNAYVFQVNVVYDWYAHSSSFEINYKTEKYKIPNLLVYNPITGTSSNIRFFHINANTEAVTTADVSATAHWFGVNSSSGEKSYFSSAKNANFITAETLASGNYIDANIILHYTADSKLGIVL